MMDEVERLNIDSSVLESLLPLAAAYAVKLAGVLALLFAAWLAARYLSNGAARGLERARFDVTLSRFLAKLIRWGVLVLGLMAALGSLGVNVTTFAALIGAAGLALGLAFQATLSNFAAGVMLLVFRPFKVGDFVCAAGQAGSVEEIALFSTIMNTADNRRVVLPNATVFGSVIENFSYHSTRRIDLSVGVSYDADMDLTRETLERAAAVDGRLDGRVAEVVLCGLGASSVDWQIRLWVQASDYLQVKQALIHSVKLNLDEAGIAIPFPQMEVRVAGAASS